jgi:hypothetical protein
MTMDRNQIIKLLKNVRFCNSMCVTHTHYIKNWTFRNHIALDQIPDMLDDVAK